MTADGTPAVDLDTIRARAEAATGEQWVSRKALDAEPEDDIPEGWWVKGPDYVDGLDDSLYFSEPDAQFVAAAREDIPALLGMVDTLKAALERLHTWDGLMSLLDFHYPADVFDGITGDPGPEIVTLLRRLNELRFHDPRPVTAAMPKCAMGCGTTIDWEGFCPPCDAEPMPCGMGCGAMTMDGGPCEDCWDKAPHPSGPDADMPF